MPLTYQPFAETPEVAALGSELRTQSRSGSDGPLAMLGGALLVLAGASTRGLLRWLLFFLGGALLRHGIREK